MNINVRNAVFAICACLFAITGLAGLMVYGSETARQLAIGIALLCCFSQFIAQDQHPLAGKASVAVSYVAFLLAVVALICFR